MRPDRVPVLIAGGGTVGLSAALFLADQGVPALAVERHAGLSVHPRALGIGARTMELFRGAGVEDAVRAAASRLPQGGGVIAVDTLAGADLAAVAGRPSPPAPPWERFSPTSGLACSQDRLDPVLMAAARERGTTVRFGTEVVALDQDEEGVTATVVERASGDRRQIRAGYVIAADGAASGVRRALGIPSGGPGSLGHHLINVLFEADLGPLVGGHDFVLCSIQSPAAPGLLIRIRDDDRWVYHFAYDPANGETPDDFPPERCRELVRAAIGLPDLDVAIPSILPWQVEARVAARFRQGRVFLAGDAAHVVPPTGGFGMNTGIAAAHNLAWKLALALSGRGGEALLDTYDAERRPVALFTLEQSMLRLAHPDLHFDAGRAAERERLGIANALVVDLGCRYAPAGTDAPAPPPSLERLECDLDGSPGTRLPHLWVERGGERLSTLDLVAGRYTLLAGADGADWRQAAPVAAARVGIDVNAYRIGAGDVAAAEGCWEAAAGISPAGALLARPDGFVAWRAVDRAEYPVAVLAAELARQLGRPTPPTAAGDAAGRMNAQGVSAKPVIAGGARNLSQSPWATTRRDSSLRSE